MYVAKAKGRGSFSFYNSDMNAMDDFGTWFSSLSYLQRLPVNTLKIDRSFIRQIPYANSDCTLTRAIIAMGRSLDLRVIAESVETPEQLQLLERTLLRRRAEIFIGPPPALLQSCRQC